MEYSDNIEKLEILGKINDSNSFERVYRMWQDIMWKKDLFKDARVIGIKHDKNKKLYLFYYYEDESKLIKDNAFLPHTLINK